MTVGNCNAKSANPGEGRRVMRAGFRFSPLLMVLALTACYIAPTRMISEPLSWDTGETGRPPRTQIHFYPKSGQTLEQQERDCYECNNWAVEQTGYDPSLPLPAREQRVRVVPSPPSGYDTTAGAVTGAVVGALAGGPRHAAGGALIGAAVGAIAGAASDSARQESARRIEETYADRDRARSAQLDRKAFEYRRAMSACLEGRGYSVK